MITQAYGCLELGFTKQFRFLWNDQGSGANQDGAFWLPVKQSGVGGDWRAIGAVGVTNYHDVNGRMGGLLIRAAGGSEAIVASPRDYERIWADHGSGAKHDGAVWRPIPPDGYAALGDLFWGGYGKPPLNAIWCVRKDFAGRAYVSDGAVGDGIWNDRKSGADRDVSTWSIQPPPYPDNQDEMLLLPAGTLTAVGGYDKPYSTPVSKVLNLPSAATVLPGPPVPVMTSYEQPPPTVRIVDRRDIVPYTLVRDNAKPEEWRVDNSPFYTLLREQWYEQVMFRDNRNGSQPATMSHEIRTGVSREQSEAFSVKTGIQVGVESGVSFLVEGKVSVNVSLELGYEYRYNDTVFQDETKRQDMTVPPHASGTLWTMADRLYPVRRDGSVLGPNADLAFKTSAYLTGEYPPSVGVTSTAVVSLPSARDEAPAAHPVTT